MYWTVKELAAYLHIKPATLYAWATQRKIPHVKIHGLLRFDPRDIDAWLASFTDTAHLPLSTRTKTLPHHRPDRLIERAKQAVYNRRRGETSPNSSLIGKEETDGAL